MIFFRLVTIVLFFISTTTLLCGQVDWLVKLPPNHFNQLIDTETKSPQQNFKLDVISKHFQIVNVVVENHCSARDIYKLLEGYNPIHVYENLELATRDKIPDDFYYSDQWNMDIINAPKVWEEITGGESCYGEELVIAILDDGFAIDHEDLSNVIWENMKEIPGDGIDNDNNGVIDDYKGYNHDRMNDDHTELGHGSRVLGIACGEGNNGVGISGVNWNAKALLISGVNNIGRIMKSMEYVIDMKQRYIDTRGTHGANIVVSNLSSGKDRVFPEDSPDWCAFYDLAGELGILSVSAAPNEFYNVDDEGDLPTLCQSEFLITVTNTDHEDMKADLAAVGPINVDIGAPGESVFSSDVNNGYAYISGCSASAPHVAGAIALLYSSCCDKFRDLVEDDRVQAARVVKEAILAGAVELSSLSQIKTKGRLDLFNSYIQLGNYCNEDSIAQLEIKEVRFVDDEIQVFYNTDNFEEHQIFLRDISMRKMYSEEFLPPILNEERRHFDILNRYDFSSGIYIFTIVNSSTKTSQLVRILND